MATAHVGANTYASRLEHTLPVVRERVRAAATEAGRAPSSVRIVAVTKSHPLEAVDAALAAGLHDLGENRVEELDEKVAARGRAAATWHMIGHVQSRKARRASELADLIHSVDSVHLAERLSRIAVEDGREVAILAQVNTSGESSKSGFELDGASERIHEVAELPGLRVEGLMTMAPLVEDEVTLARAFSRLRELGGRLGRNTDRVGPELSMGMTNDFEIAIREGSTMVRIGTALFGARTGDAQ
jgi:PLP dependent protein